MGVTVTSNKASVKKTATKRARFTLKDFAEYMSGQARENHPYQDRSANNTGSITFGPITGTESFRVFTESGYGGYLEIGTKRMRAFPYFRPAFDKAAKRMPAIVRKFNK